MASYRKSFEAKGKSGQHKRYFKGKYKKASKRKLADFLELTVGEYVVFRFDSKTLLGVISQKIRDGHYEVKPCEVDSCEKKYVISKQNDPKAVDSLKIPIGELKPAVDVLTVWDLFGEFLFLSPGKIIHVQQNSIWVKPPENLCKHAVRVNINDICLNPYNDLKGLLEWNDQVDPGDVCLISSVLKITQSDVESLQFSYRAALQKLCHASKEKEHLSKQVTTLQAHYHKASGVVRELQEALVIIQTKTTKRVNTLLKIVSKQRNELEEYEKKLSLLSVETISLRQLVQEQGNKLLKTSQQWNADRRKLKKLEEENELLKSQVASLTKSTEVEQNKKVAAFPNLLEVRPGTSGTLVMTRKAGCSKRPSAFLPIVLPEVAASQASVRVLEKRTKELGKILKVISSQNDCASDEDIVAVLASYLKQNPTIAAHTIEAANLSNSHSTTELTPAEAVDLKILLSLPMNKIRTLRTFLKNAGADIIPSEKELYQELQERRNIYRGSKVDLEIGVTSLKKTATSELTDIPYVKVKRLKEQVLNIAARYHDAGTLQTEGFHGKLWVKIGGDKGGSSTKLAMQVVNIANSNSPHNTHLLGMFEAYDSVENLRTIFGTFTDDFVLLQEDNFHLNIQGDSYGLNVFLFGDYEFLCKIVGHMGASATYPCLWCYVRLSDLTYNNGPHSPMLWDQSSNAFQPNPSWPSERSVGDIQADLARNKVDPRKGGDRRANGANHHSIAEDPVLPIITDTVNIVPPSLHILLGLVVRYFKLLEVHCRSIDQSSLGERDAQLYEEWEEVSVTTKEADLNYLKCKEKVKEEEELMSFFKKARNFIGVPKNVRCSLPLCAISAYEALGDVEWIQCTQCGIDYDSGWYHLTCLRLKDENATNFTVCPVCKGDIQTEDDVIKSQKQVIGEKKIEVTNAKTAYDSCKARLDAVYSRVLGKRGPTEIKLNNILEKDLKVQKQAYHSQCFVGNHCKIILKSSDKLLTVISDEQLKDKLSSLFTRLNDIFSLFEARFLSEEEVQRLCHLCWAFGEWFPVAFPDEKIPPKLHFLVAHIPQCAMKWRTVGLLSEQGLESIHACLNAEERVYASVRDKQERLYHIFNQHSQRAIADRSKLRVIKRVCSVENCGGRYKMMDGVRKCQKCGNISL